MSYDAMFLVPLAMFSTVVGALSIPLRGDRLALATFAFAASAWVLGEGVLSVRLVESLHPTDRWQGWDAVMAKAEAMWAISRVAGSYLTCGVLPAFPAAFGLALALRRPRSRAVGIPLVIAMGAVSLAAWLFVAWSRPAATGLWPEDDVRWSWGSIAECVSAGACSAQARTIACACLWNLEQNPARMSELRAKVDAAQLARVHADCGFPALPAAP